MADPGDQVAYAGFELALLFVRSLQLLEPSG
jgi:hypothetical protein